MKGQNFPHLNYKYKNYFASLCEIYLEFCLDGEVMTGGLEGGGCPTFLEGRGGVSMGISVITAWAPIGGPLLAKELLELVSLRPAILKEKKTLLNWIKDMAELKKKYWED